MKCGDQDTFCRNHSGISGLQSVLAVTNWGGGGRVVLWFREEHHRHAGLRCLSCVFRVQEGMRVEAFGGQRANSAGFCLWAGVVLELCPSQ